VLEKQERMSRATACVLAVAMIVLPGCDGGGPAAQSPAQNSTTLPAAVAKAQADNTHVSPDIVTADNGFGLSVLQALQAKQGPVNLAISPLSLSMALQVLYFGSSGTTQDAMTQTLQLGSLTKQQVNDANAALQASLINPDPQVQLKIANSLWMHQDQNAILPAFTQMDEEFYGATIGDLAGAPDNVNAWVSQQTDGLIPTILPPGNYAGVAAVIVNAVYFKGQWTSAFDPNSTHSAPFTLTDGTTVPVNMMAQSAMLAYLRGAGFQMVRLPYGQGRMSMLIVLPDAGTRLADFLAGLTLDSLDTWIGQMQTEYGDVALPKFGIETANEMAPFLSILGMQVAFTCPQSNRSALAADFSALSPDLACVRSVFHKARIEVDEMGTVAAAATGITVVITTVQQPQFTINMDHPFLYAIRDDDTGELLFVGTLMDPSK
jgi:serine protease inhibitor